MTDNRLFIRGLRYNLKKNEVIANALLTDLSGDPTAIYIVPPSDAGEDYKERLEAVTKESEITSLVCDLDSGEPLKLPAPSLL